MQLEKLRKFRNQARAKASGEKKDNKDRHIKFGSRPEDPRRDNRGSPHHYSPYTCVFPLFSRSELSHLLNHFVKFVYSGDLL